MGGARGKPAKRARVSSGKGATAASDPGYLVADGRASMATGFWEGCGAHVRRGGYDGEGAPSRRREAAMRYPLTVVGAGTAKRISGPTRPARSEEDEGRASANPSDAATWGTE